MTKIINIDGSNYTNQDRRPIKKNKNVKSHKIVLWVSAIISFITMYYLILNYYNDSTEQCSIDISRVEVDYRTIFGGIGGGPDSNGLFKTIYRIGVNYNATIINLSKNPLTLISYYCINYEDCNSSVIEDIRNNGNSSKYVVNHEIKLPKPIRLEAGDSYSFVFNTHISIDTSLYSIIREIVYKENFSIAELATIFYKNGIDFFGNVISSDTTANGEIKVLVYDEADLIEDRKFFFAIKTAKGNYFSKESSWYSNDGKHGLLFTY